ncbi:hypothetical protein [Mucilaginibacter jinjuensis]|uniref:DUF922 domain-containing protein n=1 Tax=Mucilaginibacter jinjuensis TaxID=1176721 RepID=A0ABY7TDC8_9SPHI|nr:hypothetical protein [Mucilaginibacter jinjuensis]WCT13703.1 hypothetical protein PQO05_07115 [Mucilaginibacter jinjuensis]
MPQNQDEGVLVWRDVPLKIKAANFYITNVIDERTDKKIIARLIPVTASNNKNIAEPVALQGGGLLTIERFLKENLPYRDNYKPVIIKVKKLLINETALSDGRVDGKIELSLSFDLKTGEDMEAHLVNYTGGAHYIRANNQADVASSALRTTIENAVIYFNTWMEKQADVNPLLAKNVKLIFTDYHDEQPEGDTIYYSLKRPITWDDFKDKRNISSSYSAAVMPGLGFTEQTSINKGIITIHIAMKVYLPKSASWVKSGAENAYNLNHEQRHFDIVKLVSEKFKRQMLAETIPVLNYDGSINTAYFDALREMDRMQKQYDNETDHGVNASAQQRWNEFIDKELAAFKN